MRSIAFLILSAVPLFAADGATLDQLRLGKTVLGKAPTIADLKGKVVLAEEWGLQCGPCLASMPHLNAWNEEFSDFGLVVIGLHRQEASDQELKEKCTAMGIRFTICDTGHIGGSKSDGGIPHCVLFSHTGESRFDGSPRDVEASLRKAIGAMLVADLESPTKELQPIVDSLKKGGSLADALKKLNGLKGASSKATTEQAKALSDKITEGGRKRLEGVRTDVKEDPVAAYESAVKLAARWKGYEIGTKASEMVVKLKADPKVTAELKTRPDLDRIKQFDTALSARVKDDEFGTPAFKKAYGPQIKEMKKAYDAMKRLYPEARSTKEAALIVEKYDLTAGKATK